MCMCVCCLPYGWYNIVNFWTSHMLTNKCFVFSSHTLFLLATSQPKLWRVLSTSAKTHCDLSSMCHFSQQVQFKCTVNHSVFTLAGLTSSVGLRLGGVQFLIIHICWYSDVQLQASLLDPVGVAMLVNILSKTNLDFKCSMIHLQARFSLDLHSISTSKTIVLAMVVINV